jgi:hypothetical protein
MSQRLTATCPHCGGTLTGMPPSEVHSFGAKEPTRSDVTEAECENRCDLTPLEVVKAFRG